MMTKEKQLSKFFNMAGKFLELSQKQIDGLEGIYGICFGSEPVTPNNSAVSHKQRFEKLSDGWIKDNNLGIEWGPGSKNQMNWDKANKYCEDISARLPTREELQSLVDFDKHSPAIDTEIFPNTKSSWYWSSSPVSGYDSCAWCVVFIYGYVYGIDKGNDNYVRPVRASQ